MDNRTRTPKEEKHFARFGLYPDEIIPKKEKTKRTHIKKFLRYFKGEWCNFTIVISFLLLLIALNVGATFLVNMTVEYLEVSDFTQALIFWAIVTGVYVAAQLVWLINSTILSRMINRVVKKIRYELNKQILSTQVSKFDSTSSGEILNRINTDPERFCEGIPEILNSFKAAIVYLGRLAIFFTFSIWMGLYLTVACIILTIISIIISRKYKTPAIRRRVKIMDRLSNITTEMTRGIRDLKSLNLEKTYLDRVDKNLVYTNNAYNSVALTRNTMDSVFDIVSRGFFIGSKALGVFLITQGMFSIANILTLTSYEDGIYYGVGRIGYIKDSLNIMEVSARRMDEILNPEEYPKESFGTKELKNVAGNVEFNHVDFGYGDKNIFKDLSFNVKAGETVGIVGRSGEGKTTILNLLPRFYDVSKGNIKIDGINIQELTQESLRNTVSIVPQSPYIFNVSIRDNLLYAKPDATQDEIEDACKKAALHDFIISKPDGYDTFVGEGGVVLSGGQKQRLAIARALLKKSKILLLDEATSALDNETQQKIKKAIANIGTECTVIIVAHRLTTVEDCDKILVLSNHRIEAEGTHKQLLKKCEVYRELYTQNDDE